MNTLAAPSTATPSPPSREQLLYWLHEAAEIEHNLMCCYLYAAFSVKSGDARWSEEQARLAGGWRRIITAIALEEMTHLCLVGNLMNALGSPAHFNRPPFPIQSGPYPADFVIRLQPFSQETIAHFQFLERPHTAAMDDAAGFEPPKQYRRSAPPGRLSPGARDYATVGELYQTLRDALEAFVAAHGETELFIGDPALQVDAALAPLPGVTIVTDLASALHALDTIVTQGEGAGSEAVDSHFCRFTCVAEELDAAMLADPAFEPAWDAATNPVMNPPPTPDGKVHVTHPENARWLDIGNALYTTSLRCLLQGFATTDRAAKAVWLAGSFALMRATVPVGQGLAARPATPDLAGPRGGLTFTPLRTLTTLPGWCAAEFMAERLGQLRKRAEELPVVPVAGETPGTWDGVIATLAQQQKRLAALSTGRIREAALMAPVHAAPIAPVAAPVAVAADAAVVEEARGTAASVLFEARRCIHSRHCVLEAPTVFKANTAGEWIFPDTTDVATLVAVAHNCPSGAIHYERHDGGAGESAPPVNTLKVRENGPYALHAPILLAGEDDGFRATLCRCGHSARKPWCDGSHVTAGFMSSGEPPSGVVEPLTARDGPLHVTPLRNGPLQIEGNLEICTGTGRTVARIIQTRLCRCGQSRN